MYKLAGELTPRASVHHLTSQINSSIAGGPYVSASSKICPSRGEPPAISLIALDDGGDTATSAYAELCARIREISSRVSELESRIVLGNELLEEVRCDLQNRVSRFDHLIELGLL